MEFIHELKQLKLFSPTMVILDVGCKNGWLFDRLKKPGRTYDAVDIIDELPEKEGIRFYQESFTTFVPDRTYDLIFARNTFFFQPDQLLQAERYLTYLKPEGVLCVSFMMEDDPHVGKKGIDGTFFYGISQNDLKTFIENKNILWMHDFEQEALDLGNNLVSWHLCMFIIKR